MSPVPGPRDWNPTDSLLGIRGCEGDNNTGRVWFHRPSTVVRFRFQLQNQQVVTGIFKWVAPSHTHPSTLGPASSFPASGKGSRRGQTLEGHFGDANKRTERNRQCNTVHAVSKMFRICYGVRIHQVKRKQRPNTLHTRSTTNLTLWFARLGRHRSAAKLICFRCFTCNMRPVPSSLDSTAAFDEVHRRVTKNIAWTDRVEWSPSLPNDRVAVYRNVLYIVPANRVQSCLGGNVAIGSGHFVQPWKHWNLTWQLSGFGQDVLFCSVTSANNTLLGGCAWALLPSLALFHSTPSQQSTWWRSALLAALEQVRSQWAGQANVPASQNQLHCIKISLRSCRILTASRCNSRNELLQRQRHSLLSKCEQHILWLHITMNLSGILQRVEGQAIVYSIIQQSLLLKRSTPTRDTHVSR